MLSDYVMRLVRLAGLAAVMTTVTGSPAQASGGHWAEELSSPHRFLWLGADPWTPDQRRGLCRVDVDMSQPLKVVLDEVSCERSASEPGQVAVDAVRNYVYVPDMSRASWGVWRLSYDPIARRLHTPVLLAPQAKLGPHRPSAVALGPDGKLYVTFARSVAVLRLTDPHGEAQGVEWFGMSSRPQGAVGLAFAGRSLFIAEPTAVSKMGISGGYAVAVPQLSAAGRPVAISSDGANVLVVSESPTGQASLLRYRTDTNEVETVQSGTETASVTPAQSGEPRSLQ
jgi:hypothetical protein